MTTRVVLYGENDLVMGHVDCENSEWALVYGVFVNNFDIFVPVTHAGKVQRLTVGNWYVGAEGITGVEQHIESGSTVVLRAGGLYIGPKIP